MATPSTRARIAALLESGRPLSAAAIARRLTVTRPVVVRHLNALIKEDRAVREGEGRRTRYRAAGAVPVPPKLNLASFVRRYPRVGLSETTVWHELVRLNPELANLSNASLELFRYAFTELLNNAVEHSAGTDVEVQFSQSGDVLSFEIIDNGVGLFSHLRQRLGLDSTDEAAKRLSQGKLPPMPDARTGSGKGVGIFFCAHAARRFEVESNGYRFLVDNQTGNAAAASAPPRAGTRVRFDGELSPRQTLSNLLGPPRPPGSPDPRRPPAPPHPARVVVTLGTRFISRTEAQKLLNRLARYQTVVLDFKEVREIGPGFADEVFRVWPHHHPGVTLQPINMSPGVSVVVDHARAGPMNKEDR